MANLTFYVAIIFSCLMLFSAPDGRLYEAFMGVGIVYALLHIAEEISRGKSDED